MDIKQSLDIINFAIKNNISVSEASEKSGFNRSYVKNVKRKILDKYENEIIDEETYQLFMNAYENYEASRSPQNYVN